MRRQIEERIGHAGNSHDGCLLHGAITLQRSSRVPK
jgi:hypothetical protein